MAAAVFTVIIVLSQQTATQAGPEVSRAAPRSLLPQTIGVAIPADDAVVVAFEEPMDPASVEAAVQLVPTHSASLSWNEDLTELSIAPERRWRTDESYLVIVGPSATADGDASAAPQRFAFSTQTAPTVSDFQVRAVGDDPAQVDRAAAPAPVRLELSLSEERTLSPNETAREVSPLSSVRIGFTSPMDRTDVEDRFTITPEVAGELSWSGDDLVFTPTAPLESGGRYTISLVGARDRTGSELGGKLNFTFLVRSPAQLVSTTPALDAQDVETGTVEMWFSQPMDVDATNAAFGLTDTRTGRLVAGFLNWNEAGTQLVYSPSRAFAGGRTFEVALGDGASDVWGNPITTSWSFSTAAAPTRAAAAAASGGDAPQAVAFVPMEASGLEGYAINQINAARAAYGFGPLALDWTLSAVAAAHAWDQLNYGYYSHSSRNGASVHQRLAAAGVGFSAAGENQCHASMGLGAQGTMDWCHGVFMSEPWPGYWNHIGNILSQRYTRVGIGVADNGSRVVITWDFSN